MLSEEPPTIEYTDSRNGTSYQIKGQWLIGADGKVGIVRKRFLEPVANIKQEVGTYPYDGTWVAANLQMSLPTPETHPEFPLWRLGYKPQEVYDLFWPDGWHFCSPPGKATASGRFGPHSERFWRHEFRQDDWDDGMDAEALLWEHITPMITREEDTTGRKFGLSLSYPRDCIKVLRCRPFRFTQKVVNRWFHKRTVLIGDAAHVFPPFAGQGIASGIRDAHQLAWRLALLINNDASRGPQATSAEAILQAWALERRRSVDDAAFFSMLNGRLCNHRPAFWIRVLLCFTSLAERIPFLPRLPSPEGILERRGFTTVRGGFFLKDFRGGARLAQIHVESSSDKVSALSDTLLHRSPGIFTLIVISKDDGDGQNLYQNARTAILGASLDSSILSEESIVLFNPRHDSPPTSALSDGCGTNGKENAALVYRAEITTRGAAYIDRLGHDTKFALVRPDFLVFACTRDMNTLVTCLQKLKERIYTR
jgi:2-polyprenyl-6-methoxyphenol hydroxylase-like FAD-dependent oxidoreductase